jgi:4-hydroxy-tetrahydrodipicolinate synthase
MTKIFRGVFAVTCTPFDEAGGIDESALRRHLRWMVDEGGVHGVVPTGSTGEFAFLSEAERKQVVAITIDEIQGKLPVVVGSAACSTRETVMYAQYAQNAGAQGVMVVPPYYGHLSQAELYTHFKELAKSIDIPILLYNNPGTSGSDLLPETVARLSEIKNVRGIKESTGNMQRVHAIQIACSERFEIVCGCDTLPLEMFRMGVEGWVAAPANTIPAECVRLYELAIEKKDEVNARALYFNLLPLFELFEGTGQYVQLNKCALELLNKSIGLPRKPLLPCDSQLKKKLGDILEKIHQSSELWQII